MSMDFQKKRLSYFILHTIPTIIFNIQFSIESDNRTDIWMESRADYTAFRSG